MTAGEVNHTRKASNDNVRTSGTATRPKSPSSSQWASKIGHRPWPSMSQVESEAELADRSVPRNSMSAPNSRRASASSHRRGPSVGQVEAEAHKPTLKGVGKSDCEVKIVNIMDCETSVPIASLSEKNQTWTSDEMRKVLANARSPSPKHNDNRFFSGPGSRAARVQKALRRPPLAYRKITPRPAEGSRSSNFKSPRQYVNDSTIRRLMSGMWAVRKEAFSDGMQDGGRLLKQIKKQIVFSALCRTKQLSATISTPEIYGLKHIKGESGNEKAGIVVDMEYIPFHDVRYIMLEQDKAISEWLVTSAITIVDHELTQASNVSLKEILPEFQKKATSIKSSIQSSALLEAAEAVEIKLQIDSMVDYFGTLPDLQVPVGTCHGDLTFQNMLVDPVNRELCIFDFLDCFVESPLQDIAKLLQDCRHQWFLTQIEIPQEKRARAVTTLEFYHHQVRAAYYDYAFWDVLPLFEFFCLARILPYMTNLREKQCVVEGLRRVFGDVDISRGPSDSFAARSSDEINTDVTRLYEPSTERVSVIVPALGPDMGRIYADGQIKLLAINPNGRPVVVDSISSLAINHVSNIYLAVMKSLVLSYCSSIAAFEALFDVLGSEKRSKLHFFYSERETIDAVDTVTCVIEHFQITGPLFIKDADNGFAHSVDAGNYLTFLSVVKEEVPTEFSELDLRPDLIDATRKSYVSFSYDNIVSNISYGSFVSSNFCCGGWGFLQTSDFLSASTSLRTLIPKAIKEGQAETITSLTVVDVIWQLICEGHLFFGAKVHDYEDWGSRTAWMAYKGTYTPYRTNSFSHAPLDIEKISKPLQEFRRVSELRHSEVAV